MGNILEPSKSSYFLSEVSGTFLHLTKCNQYTGVTSDILMLQQRVAKFDLLHSCFVDPSQVKQLFKNTPIEGCELIVINHFMKKPIQKINIMEVLAAIIAYSSESLENKVKLAVEIFDFDENQVITYNEMLVLSKSFINGIGIMTNSALYSKATLEALGDQAFIMADSTPDGRITYEEFLEFVRSNEIISELLRSNQPVQRPQHAKRKSIIEELGFEVTNKHKFEGRTQAARHRTEPKKAAYRKNEEKDEILIEIEKIFQQSANNRGRILVRELYDYIRNSAVLGPVSDKVIEEFKFRLTSEVNFEEVKLCLVKRKGTRISTEIPLRPSSLREHEAVPQRPVQNLGVLKEMFDKFDVNMDGTISLAELKKGLKDKFSVASIEEMFREYDFDNNGCLDFNEFVRLFSPDGAYIPGNN